MICISRVALAVLCAVLVSPLSAGDFTKNTQTVAALAPGTTSDMVREALGAPIVRSFACGKADIAAMKREIKSVDDLLKFESMNVTSFDEMFADIDTRASTCGAGWDMWVYPESSTRFAIIFFDGRLYSDHLSIDYPGGLPARVAPIEIRDRQLPSFAALTELQLGSSYQDARRIWKPSLELTTPLDLYKFFRAAGLNFSEHVSRRTYAAMQHARLVIYTIGGSLYQYQYYNEQLIGGVQLRLPPKSESPDQLRTKY